MAREGNQDPKPDTLASPQIPSLHGPDSTTEPTAVQSFTARARLGLGSLVDGKYEIESILGEGAMGIVFRAVHKELGEPVALKFLISEQEGFDFRARFRREAQICAKIRNEHIARVIDVGTWQGEAYMVLEYLSGHDLATLPAQSGPLSVGDAVDYVVQVCIGLAEVHAHGIVHRDLKPTNLFLTRRADGSPLVKILDFGISKWTNEPVETRRGLTKVGTVLGTPEYMAPEQLYGSNTVDSRADVWALGAILYELLTGRTPFTETTFAKLCAELGKGEPPKAPRVHRPDLPVEVDAAIMLCLQPDLEKRIPNVAALAGELLAAVGDPSADAVRSKLEETLDRVARASGAGRISHVPTSSGSMRSGDYVAQQLRGSLTPVADPTRASADAPAVTAAEAPPSGPRRPLLVALAASAGVLALVAIYFVSARKSPRPDVERAAVAETAETAARAGASAAPSPPPAEEPTPPAAPSATPTTEATATVTPSAAAAPAAVLVPAATAKPALVGLRRSTPPAATANPAPSVSAVPSATAAPPPKKTNPLEDRQ